MVNWLDDSYIDDNGLGYDEVFTDNDIICMVFKKLVEGHRSCKYYIYDPETSDDSPPCHSRVLDDSPVEEDWVEFFKYHTVKENHKAFFKAQKDGSTLYVFREAYPRATSYPDFYVLVEEAADD